MNHWIAYLDVKVTRKGEYWTEIHQVATHVTPVELLDV